MYRIEITNTAHHQIRSLSHTNQRRVHVTIEKLVQDPRHFGVKKLRGEIDFYRVRVGEHRVLFTIDDSEKLIVVQRVMPRENAY
jgi:mRNA interferase RelE/StbE